VAPVERKPFGNHCASDMECLSIGNHPVSVRSQDAFGNWGLPASIVLSKVVDGPVTSAVKRRAESQQRSGGGEREQPASHGHHEQHRVHRRRRRGFIDTAPASTAVRGFAFVPADGAWNAAQEVGYGDIPLSTIKALSNGNHTIFVRGKDAAGNWGNTATTILVIDKVAPTLSSITLSANTIAQGTASVTLTMNAADVGVGVTGRPILVRRHDDTSSKPDGVLAGLAVWRSTPAPLPEAFTLCVCAPATARPMRARY